MKLLAWLFFTLITLSEVSIAQNAGVHFDYPLIPLGGWTSLKTVIEYPEIAARAGYTGVVLVQVWVDSTGVVDSVKELWSSHEVFTPAVVEGIRLLRWLPLAPKHSREQPYVIPVVFDLKGEKRNLLPSLPIIEKDMPEVKVKSTY